ncbi:MAG: hypothetical protein ACOC1L_03015 [Bacillota bacterium]
MKPQTLLKKLIIGITISILHLGLSVLLYQPRHWLSAVLVITALINSWILLQYFSYTIQHILAHRIAKRHPVDHRFVLNIIFGIVINALLIYGLFVMMIAHIVTVIDYVN